MSVSPPNVAAIKTANRVKEILKHRERPLARVVGFKDNDDHTSVATSEWEHLELRGKAMNAVRFLHKVDLHDVKERILYLSSKLDEVPDKIFSWVRYINEDGVERRQRRHIVEAELSLCRQRLKLAEKACSEATNNLTKHQAAIDKKLSKMCSDMMAVLPPDLRQMVFAYLGPFEGKQILLETTGFKNQWVGLRLPNKARDDWRYAISVVGKQMAAELVEIMHRKNKFIVSSDTIIPPLMNNTNSLHGVMMKHVITKIQVDLREIDSGVEGNSKDIILSNLQALTELKSRNISIEININYGQVVQRLARPPSQGPSQY